MVSNFSTPEFPVNEDEGQGKDEPGDNLGKS